MLLKQYVNEFNNLACNIKCLSLAEEITIINKLKLILADFNELESDLNVIQLNVFYKNLHHVLCESTAVKSDLIEICLDVLLTSLNSKNRLRSCVLDDFQFLTVLIEFVTLEADNEGRLIKILNVIKQLLCNNCELDERSLNIIISSLGRHIEERENRDVIKLCIQILGNLCLENAAAKYLIIQNLKTSEMNRKIASSSDLVGFNFFLLLEGEIKSKDLAYFLRFSVKEISEAIKDLDIDPIKHSLDILQNFKTSGIKLELKDDDDLEEIMKSLKELCRSLSCKLTTSDEQNIQDVSSYFDIIFNYYEQLLLISCKFVNCFEDFSATSFASPMVSRSARALKYLKIYLKCEGILKSPEIIIENLFEHFIGEDGSRTSFLEKYSFLELLEILEMRGLMSDAQVNQVSRHFDDLLENFRGMNTNSIDDEEIYLFIFFLHSLAHFSTCTKSNVFFPKLDAVFRMDYLPMVCAKAHLTRNSEVLIMMFDLAKLNDYPSAKIASYLSKRGSHSGKSSTQLYNALKRRESQQGYSQNIDRGIERKLNALIDKINEKVDNNELEKVGTSDIINLYRQKMNFLNNSLSCMTETQEKFAQLEQQYSTTQKWMEKQEFLNWCQQLHIERATNDNTALTDVNKSLAETIATFRKKVTKEEEKRKQLQRTVTLKDLKVEKISAELAEQEKNHRAEMKNLKLAQKENQNRIEDLKKQIEDEKKINAKALADVIGNQKEMSQKLTVAQRECEKLQGVIKLHEKELIEKQEQIQQYEIDLKESEQMKNTIMAVMQGQQLRSNKSKF